MTSYRSAIAVVAFVDRIFALAVEPRRVNSKNAPRRQGSTLSGPWRERAKSGGVNQQNDEVQTLWELAVSPRPSEALDIVGDVGRLAPRQCHIWHFRMWLEQKKSKLFATEIRHLSDGRKRRDVDARLVLIGRDDMAGRAPMAR
jgi:hypothetical protein